MSIVPSIYNPITGDFSLTVPDAVSLGTPLGKTVVMKTGTLTTAAVTANQIVLAYTVTVLKIFYLEYVHMDGFETTLPGNSNPISLGTISLELPSGNKVISVDYFHPPNKAAVFTFAEPVPVLAGTVIRVVVTPIIATSIIWRANFGGYEK
jgi:hypothetical protein